MSSCKLAGVLYLVGEGRMIGHWFLEFAVMTDTDAIQDAVDRNFAAFKTELPMLLRTHAGKFALLRHEKVIQTFDSARDAVIFAQVQYPDGLYSIQEITSHIVDLGFFSHAVSFGSI